MPGFNLSEFERYINMLADSDDKAILRGAMVNNQQALNVLLDPASLEIRIHPQLNLNDKNPIGISHTLQTHIITNFLEPLIKQLEENRETIKTSNPNIDAEINQLKQRQMKILNSIRATANQKPLDFDLLKGKVIAAIGPNQRSFQFDSAQELESITKSIAETFLEENCQLPLNIRVSSPRDPDSNQEPPIKEFLDKILLGAAKAGIRPDQVHVVIDGTPQSTDIKNFGNDARYNQFVQTAMDVMNTKTSSQTYNLRH